MLLLKNAVFTLVVPGTVVGLIPLLILGRRDARFPEVWEATHYLALLPVSFGAALYFWSLWHFATRGRGTPAPLDPPKHLVISGPYRYVRNPMYLAVLLVLLGEAGLFASRLLLAYAAGWLAVAQGFAVFYEEPKLRDAFGMEYEQYRAAVRRWLPGRGFSGISRNPRRAG